MVWNDANSTGGIDAGEAGIAGVTVTLRNAANVVIATATSDAGGAYSFLNVPAGNYTITETDLAGYTSTTSNILSITLGAGSTSTGNNFGDIPNPGAISGTVWNDVNGNGVINAGESGISGVTISLYRDVNANGVYDPGIDTLSATTTTGATGSYSFPSNTPASYLVIETDPSGYVSTTSNIVPLIVAPGNTKIANFGESSTLPSGTIAGVVFLDANTSGAQNAGEAGVGGVTVTLKDGAGVVVATTTTLANGSFSFAALGVGSYTVSMTTPAGYVATTSISNSVVMLGGGATVAFGINQPAAASAPPAVAARGGGLGLLFGDPPLSKAASPSKAGVGDVVTFVATAFNPNATPFTNAVFTDSMPSQFTIQSVTSTQGAVTVSGQNITVNIGTMSPGQRVTITMVTVVNASAVPPVSLQNNAVLNTDQGRFGASASVDIGETVKPPLLPDTGERPLWAQFAGPLLLLLLAGVLIGTGCLIAYRRQGVL
jgi:uncharacterized repeat protein (TIGR01451 family)